MKLLFNSIRGLVNRLNFIFTNGFLPILFSIIILNPINLHSGDEANKGDEALRVGNGYRLHKQQSPIQLLTRIILCSSGVGDTVYDPFAGTGTTLVVSRQLSRNSLGNEIDPYYVSVIENRLACRTESDSILKYRGDYSYTVNLDDIWPVSQKKTKVYQVRI